MIGMCVPGTEVETESYKDHEWTCEAIRNFYCKRLVTEREMVLVCLSVQFQQGSLS